MPHDDLVYVGHMVDTAGKAIVGMRHKVVHDYFGVDEDVVWRTVTNELPPLLEKLRPLVP